MKFYTGVEYYTRGCMKFYTRVEFYTSPEIHILLHTIIIGDSGESKRAKSENDPVSTS